MADPVFGTSLRRDPAQPRDLRARIDAQIRERLEEAVDAVGLQAIVRARQARGLRAPVADDPRDRAEFEAAVSRFLERLRAEIAPPEGAPAGPSQGAVPAADLVTTQVGLARRLPDYWQQFEAVSVRYLEAYIGGGGHAPSGGEGRGLLARLFGRG
jgi:transposase